MSESRKLLIGFAVVGVLCLCISLVTVIFFREMGKRAEKMFSGDPTTMAQIKEDMVDFDVPAGYEETAMDLFVYNMVMLTPSTSSNSDSMIMLMQYNGLMPGNSAQMEEQMRQAAQQQGGPQGSSMHFVETIEKEIRGQTVEITVSEGNYQGYSMRQWLAVFEGKNGPTILMVQGSVEDWDDELLDDFIASIK
jgi:hypothetical protein